MASRFCTIVLFTLLAGCSGSTVNSPAANLASSPSTQENRTTPDHTAQQPAESQQLSAQKTSGQSPRYVVRKAVTPPSGPAIPKVLLSSGHAKLCKVQVGDAFAMVTLPKLGGGPAELTSLLGSKATVVLFWQPDRWMARTALIDMQRDVAAQFSEQEVSVVGIAVRQPQGAVQAALNQAQAKFPQLLDTDGQAFGLVGSEVLPRIYVLNPTGKIVWFDIEYSEGTRRELWQTLAVMTK